MSEREGDHALIMRLGRLLDEELKPRRMGFILLVAMPDGEINSVSSISLESTIEALKQLHDKLAEASALTDEGGRVAGHA